MGGGVRGVGGWRGGAFVTEGEWGAGSRVAWCVLRGASCCVECCVEWGGLLCGVLWGVGCCMGRASVWCGLLCGVGCCVVRDAGYCVGLERSVVRGWSVSGVLQA